MSKIVPPRREWIVNKEAQNLLTFSALIRLIPSEEKMVNSEN
jgi:hypothetical protein